MYKTLFGFCAYFRTTLVGFCAHLMLKYNYCLFDLKKTAEYQSTRLLVYTLNGGWVSIYGSNGLKSYCLRFFLLYRVY